MAPKVKAPAWLRRIGQRVRGPFHIARNLVFAAVGHHVAPFLDRKGTTPGRRFMWRALLTLVLVFVLCLAAVVLLVGAAVGVPFVAVSILAVLAYDCLHEVWRT